MASKYEISKGKGMPVKPQSVGFKGVNPVHPEPMKQVVAKTTVVRNPYQSVKK